MAQKLPPTTFLATPDNLAMPTPLHRHWVFRYDDPEYGVVSDMIKDKLRFVAGQPEQGEESNRHHFQGYAEYIRGVSAKQAAEHLRIPWVKKGETREHSLFLEPRAGTQEQACQYVISDAFCHKCNCGSHRMMDGGVTANPEFCNCEAAKPKGRKSEPVVYGQYMDAAAIKAAGKKGGAPKQSAYTAMIEMATSGATVNDIAKAHPAQFVRYSRGVASLVAAHVQPKTWKPYAVWLFGDTGIMKSRLAKTLHKMQTYIKLGGNKWFDGYFGQEIAVLDDFRKNWWTFDYWLTLIDHGPCIVEVKGDTIQWIPRMVIVTCHKSPTDLYKYTDDDGNTHEREDIQQLRRRFDLILDMSGQPDWRGLRNRLRMQLCAAREFDDQSDDEFDGTEESIPIADRRYYEPLIKRQRLKEKDDL